MIIEALTAALTPARTAHQRLARQMGYVYEAVGINARHRRCRRAWRPHLRACKKNISSAISQIPPSGRIVILGSGSWLDLPVRALSRHGAEIILVDMMHLPWTRARAHLHRNFTLLEADLTGYAGAWHDHQSREGGDNIMPEPPACAPLPLDDADLVISLNLLSQLPLRFVPVPPGNSADAELMRALQQAHMTALRAHRRPVLLISDFERTEVRPNSVDVIRSVPADILSGAADDSWQWHIAPMGELDRHTDVSLSVSCWTFSG